MDKGLPESNSLDQFVIAQCSCTELKESNNPQCCTGCTGMTGGTGTNNPQCYTGMTGGTGTNNPQCYTGMMGGTGTNNPQCYTGCTGMTGTISPARILVTELKLNPYMDSIPERFPRYRHNSHPHRLYVMFGKPNHSCDNQNCRKVIDTLETRFSCFRCNFDLCQECFQLDCENPVPINVDEDTEVNDRIFSKKIPQDSFKPVKL